MRNTDGTVIRVVENEDRTITAYFPTEKIVYTNDNFILKPKQSHQQFQGHWINDQIIQWACPGKNH